MNGLKIFLILTGYQITWLACVFGESKFKQPLLGVYIGIIYLIVFLYFNKNKFKFFKISICISLPGYFFDTLMVYFSIYNFNETIMIGILPAWMVVLWLSFSTLFDEILNFFKKHKFVGVLLSAILGPLTYYLGEPIGVISISNVLLFFIIMVIFWILLMIYYLNIILKKTN
tara:strand:+ start:331 stop:846 length:516 start_codon:yes stop_codon:yes gene_type:complete